MLPRTRWGWRPCPTRLNAVAASDLYAPVTRPVCDTRSLLHDGSVEIAGTVRGGVDVVRKLLGGRGSQMSRKARPVLLHYERLHRLTGPAANHEFELVHIRRVGLGIVGRTAIGRTSRRTGGCVAAGDVDGIEAAAVGRT